MSESTADLLSRAGKVLVRWGVQDDPNGRRVAEAAAKALTPEVPTTDSLAQDNYLNQKQAEALIDMTVSQNEWLSVVTVKTVGQRKGFMPKITINDVVTEGVPENGGRTIATHPDTSESEYDCGKYQATMYLTLEDVEENRAQGNGDFETTVRMAFAKAMGNDMARAGLLGDTSLAATSRLNRLLNKRDGWLKQARALANYKTTTRGTAWARRVYAAMVRRMPKAYKDDPNLRFLMPGELDESFTDYAQGLADGSALRDRALLENTRFRPMGKDTLIVPQWPTDQGFDSLTGSTSDPDLVTDNSDGTLTVRVDTLFGGYSASHAGRVITVTCDETGESETLEVEDVSSHLVVTTEGSLGQSTISETEGDYSLDLADCTGMMLGNPRNLFVAMCRKIRAWRKWEQESERWRIDIFYEADYGIFVPEALVLQEGIVPANITFGD